MKNEELCLLIKQGDTGYLPELWEQTRKFIAMQAKRFYFKGETHNGVEIEDLVQSGYFAVLQAVEHFEPERGFTFINFLAKTLNNAFCEVIGIRSSKRDMLNYAASLDEPYGGDENRTLLHFIGDLTPGSGDVEAAVIESVYLQELHCALDNALAILPDKKR